MPDPKSQQDQRSDHQHQQQQYDYSDQYAHSIYGNPPNAPNGPNVPIGPNGLNGLNGLNGPNYFSSTPFYHRFVQSPAPFYLAGYTADSNGFIEIGGYHDGGQGKDLNFAYGPDNSVIYDPVYAHYPYGYLTTTTSQNYYENGGQIGYPIGGYSSSAPFIDESG